jgi:hypothetical protein
LARDGAIQNDDVLARTDAAKSVLLGGVCVAEGDDRGATAQHRSCVLRIKSINTASSDRDGSRFTRGGQLVNRGAGLAKG